MATKKKKKFSAKQLAAQRLFAKRSKAGTLKKSSRKTRKSTKSTSRKSRVKPRTTRRERGGAASDIPPMARALLLAIKDPKVKEIVIKK